MCVQPPPCVSSIRFIDGIVRCAIRNQLSSVRWLSQVKLYMNIEILVLYQDTSTALLLNSNNLNLLTRRLLVKDPPTFPVDRSVILPLPASPQPIPHFLPPGFVVELSNGTSGMFFRKEILRIQLEMSFSNQLKNEA